MLWVLAPRKLTYVVGVCVCVCVCVHVGMLTCVCMHVVLAVCSFACLPMSLYGIIEYARVSCCCCLYPTQLGDRTVHIRSYLASFNIVGDVQSKLVGKLSGGERNRVHLAKALRHPCNLLLLDEPTNDLGAPLHHSFRFCPALL
jgi:ABC-type hemin transport system ATPase subunit